ncbi:MAG: DNA-directed RNA polymerase subunit omega [Oscillospiraceae bacterium]|jgi:DNA-directed RNA polymerase omega subunit|nr:DNA-directed RNA polymerase subunit omega [Oscillospiraceae bacterium]
MTELLTKINSRYLLVNAIARRSRQISDEAEKDKIPLERKAVTLAIEEISDDIYTVKTRKELF